MKNRNFLTKVILVISSIIAIGAILMILKLIIVNMTTQDGGEFITDHGFNNLAIMFFFLPIFVVAVVFINRSIKALKQNGK